MPEETPAQTAARWSAKAKVLRSRRRNNALHDIMQGADYLEEAAKRLLESEKS